MTTTDHADAVYLEHARAALAQYELPTDLQLRRISLSENATFLAERPDLKVIVRVYRADSQSEAAVRSELHWIEALRAGTSVRTPAVLRTSAGELLVVTAPGAERRLCAAFEHVEGRELPEDGLGVYRSVGRTAAQLHTHVRAWALPDGFERRTWDVESVLGPDAPWGDWRDGPAIDRDSRTLLERAERRIRERLADYPAAGERGGLVHGDLRAANLIVDPAGELWIIDFDDSGFSWFLWDLCSTTTFIETAPNLDQIIAAWLAGYSEQRSLQPADLAVIPDLVFLRRLHVLAWLGSHPESDLARSLSATFAGESRALAERYLNGEFARASVGE